MRGIVETGKLRTGPWFGSLCLAVASVLLILRPVPSHAGNQQYEPMSASVRSALADCPARAPESALKV